jgi:hypothetical protein
VVRGPLRKLPSNCAVCLSSADVLTNRSAGVICMHVKSRTKSKSGTVIHVITCIMVHNSVCSTSIIMKKKQNELLDCTYSAVQPSRAGAAACTAQCVLELLPGSVHCGGSSNRLQRTLSAEYGKSHHIAHASSCEACTLED